MYFFWVKEKYNIKMGHLNIKLTLKILTIMQIIHNYIQLKT